MCPKNSHSQSVICQLSEAFCEICLRFVIKSAPYTRLIDSKHVWHDDYC